MCSLGKQGIDMTITTERHSANGRQRNRRRRYLVLSHYSGGEPSCACCGEHRPEFLGIDPIDGGGREHRKKLGAGSINGNQLYGHLVKEGFPPGYRVLCHNCNLSMGFYGYCPHESPEKSAELLAQMHVPGWAESYERV